jgi:hypothetical protein
MRFFHRPELDYWEIREAKSLLKRVVERYSMDVLLWADVETLVVLCVWTRYLTVDQPEFLMNRSRTQKEHSTIRGYNHLDVCSFTVHLNDYPEDDEVFIYLPIDRIPDNAGDLIIAHTFKATFGDKFLKFRDTANLTPVRPLTTLHCA